MPNTLVKQAKTLMDAADAMHDTMCAEYGENNDCAVYALQASLASFLLFCTLEQLVMDEEDNA
jgi:hypothetical protein